MGLLRALFVAAVFLCHVVTQVHAIDFTQEIVNPCNPSVEDYRYIQRRLAGLLEQMSLPPIAHHLRFYFAYTKFVGERADEVPIFDTIYLNQDPENKKNCIVLYATYNPPYADNVLKIIDKLKSVGFNGHVIYRIGGYPNVEHGSLDTIHIPYAFKACALQEACLLGYQNLLWIDSSVMPVGDLSPLFERIEKEGYFAMSTGGTIRGQVDNGYLNEELLAAIDIPYPLAAQAFHITTPAFGLNTHSAAGRAILERFCAMARQGSSFFSDWPDEMPLSAIFYHLQLSPSGVWSQFMMKDWEGDAREGRYFSMSRQRPKER